MIKTEPDYKSILFSLCASLTLCDHMGDVCEDVFEALKKAGIKTKDANDLEDVYKLLPEGTRTLYGTIIGDDDDGEGENE